MTTENLLSGGVPGSVWPDSTDGFIEQANSIRLFVRSARPVGKVRAQVIVTHGLGEHSGRYGHVATELVRRGFAVTGWDLRGHGRSSGARGDLRDYGEFLDDLAEVYRAHAVSDGPVFLFGHSLGGQITLRFLEEKAVDCRGAIVASPWLRLAYDPPWWKLVLARLAMWCWPAFAQHTGNRPERLSRDFEHLASFPDLDLVHHRISARKYFTVRAAGEEALAEAARVHVPLLLIHGDADPVTCHRASREFFERADTTDKTLRIVPGALHETHNDLDRAQVIREIGDWIEARLSREG